MSLLPKDTNDLLTMYNNNFNKIPNLWYPVNYYHFKDRNRPTNVENRPKRELSNKKIGELGIKIEAQRTQALLESDIHFTIIRGNLERGILPGFGAVHVNETTVTIHQTYGMPYIPASSVKGVVRKWFINEFLDGKEEYLLADTKEIPEYLRDHVEIGKLMFGAESQRGIGQFYDIYLHENCLLRPNMQVSLFRDYYNVRSDKMASDTMGTNPFANFYEVNVDYANVTVSISPLTKTAYDYKTLLRILENWTSNALEQLGVGAKTATGFGRFSNMKNVTDEMTEAMRQEIERAERKRKEEEEKRRIELEQIKLREKLEQMSPEERLIHEINMLTTDQHDGDRSKGELYQQVLEQENKGAAKALQVYWEKTGNWNARNASRKQKEKIAEIKKLLEK